MVTAEATAEPPRRDRLGRLLFPLGLAVLAIGIVAFLVVAFRGYDKAPPPPLPNLNPKAVPARIEPAARKVAGEFILTAVARENVGKSWTLTHPKLRAGYTKAEWTKGEIPIAPYPVESLDEARFNLAEKYPNELLLEVALIPKEGAKIEAAVFALGLKAVGTGKARHWLVDYWMPRWNPPVPTAP